MHAKDFRMKGAPFTNEMVRSHRSQGLSCVMFSPGALALPLKHVIRCFACAPFSGVAYVEGSSRPRIGCATSDCPCC